MPRVADPLSRLQSLATASTTVFGRLGYRRTKVAGIATEAGMSPGAVYTYVESKEALFHLVFAHGFGRLEDLAGRLPLATPPFTATVELIDQGLRRRAATPRMRRALAQPEPADIRAELTGILEERYTLLERLWPLLAVIESCAVDLPELEDLYFRRARPGQLDQLTRYLRARSAAGHLRDVADAGVVSRLLTESITWFAWHRRGDREEHLYDGEGTMPAVVGFLCDALVNGAP
jgi:AcrR family transcriptional regulator